MPSGTEPTEEGAGGSSPSAEEISWQKKRRTQLRKQITTTCNQIDSLISRQGSRGSLKGLLEHLRLLQRDLSHVHTDQMSVKTVATENDKQEESHLRYMEQFGEALDKADQYLESRAGDAASVTPDARVRVEDPSITQRRDEDLAAAQRRATEAQRRAEEAREEVAEAERVLISLSIHDDDHHSSVSHQRHAPLSGNRPPSWPGAFTGGRVSFNNLIAPDDWIDQYSRGALPPVIQPRGSRSSVSAELDLYNGKSLDWFSWIDVFKALVHDTPKSAGEKLALLKRYVRGDCLDIIYGLGGGESAYIEALVRLKQSCGRRDVMRAAHIQAIDKLEFKNDPASFKRFAEKIRTHLFDLTRIGEASTADIIERVCQRLSLHDRLAWNEGRWGQTEHRSLNDFGSWICQRAASYQNAYTLAADQMALAAKEKASEHRRARTHQGSTGVNEGKSRSNKSPFCFKCEKDHRLSECSDFKECSVGERVTFCIRHHLCFCCFGTKHSAADCPLKKPCKYENCRYIHHDLLHDPKTPVRKAKPSTTRSGRQRVDLGMMRLEVSSTDGRSAVRVNVFVDEGSDSTLMADSCAAILKLRGEPQILEVDGVGGEIRRHTSKRVQFNLRAESGEQFTMEASTMKTVANPAPVVDWSKKKFIWPHLADLPVGEVGGKVDLLIGMDYAHLLVVQESRGGRVGEPIASCTKLGWIVRGVTDTQDTRNSVRSYRIVGNTLLEDLKIELRRFCDTEEFGTEFQAGCLTSDNKHALDLVEKKTRKLEVGYEVPIIWREGEPVLTNNQDMAMNRWRSLLRQFARRPDFEEDYRAAMAKTFDQGYASILPNPSDAKYFLAHHGVYKGKKLRVVFDAAAPFQGKCLNDAILAGPALQPSLAAVIIRFRAYDVAWASDVEAMFSRFRLSAEDVNYFCFLWGQKGKATPDVCRMDRLPFGASCSPFVAIYAIRRIMEDAGASESILSVVRDSMYVDDYLNSAPSVEEAVAEAAVVRKHLLDADLKLQRWMSNSTDFVQQMAGGGSGSPIPSTHLLSPDPEEKVLGVTWNVHADTLGFQVAEYPSVQFTRVELISQVASVFDPLGTASPLIVKAKIRLRELGVKGLQWTDVVDDDDRSWWEKWFVSLQLLIGIEAPRCLFPNARCLISSEIHVFCDASEEAYAAVVYVRNLYTREDVEQEVLVRQVKAANKLAPKKCISVPKLELNAALLGARVARSIEASLPVKITRRRFWTDSSTVRNWIRATAAYYQVFVSNRIGEIQTLTEAEEWRFVPGVLNPADAATRSTLDGDIFPSAWLSGPDFLLKPDSEWPVDLPWMAIKEELRPARTFNATQLATTDWSQVQVNADDVPALCKLNEDFLGLVRQCQLESFAEELRRLQKKKTLHSTSSLLALAPILGDDGLLRLGGRAGRAQLPYDQLHPPFLSGQHPFAEKVVRAFHENLNHVGTDFLLCYVRQHFWVTRGRELVKKIRRDCVVCKRNRAQPGEQMMADLNESRLDYGTLPFTRTAVDLFGPMEISLYRNKTAKRWGVLYTCLVTRAVFLELVPSLSSTDFLLSLRKFITLYRSPEVLHFDNGINFVGSSAVELLNCAFWKPTRPFRPQGRIFPRKLYSNVATSPPAFVIPLSSSSSLSPQVLSASPQKVCLSEPRRRGSPDFYSYSITIQSESSQVIASSVPALSGVFNIPAIFTCCLVSYPYSLF